jgi:hypothetical protein
VPRGAPGVDVRLLGTTHSYAATREEAMTAFAKSLAEGMNGQGEQHARDRSCFAQYRNNGFAAHRR